MTFSFSNIADAVRSGVGISAEDVLELRRLVWSDGTISQAEAETIFKLNSLAKERDRAWVDFFVEAINEFVVNEQEPRGYVDESKAQWLMKQIDGDGKVGTLAELELLVKVVESALSTPESLKSYALGQIERVIVSGEGPTRADGALRPGMVDAAEVKLLRRLLYAAGSQSGTTVSRDEAELLWRLKEACKGGGNDPEWKTLFVQAVGNHLMAHEIYHALKRGDAQRLEAFMADTHGNIGGFLKRMVGNLGNESRHPGQLPVREAFGRKRHEDLADEVEADRAITPDENQWLEAHVAPDGATDELEQALLDFIADESKRSGL